MLKNFGIIGCGMIANFHAKAIESIGGKIAACYDRIPQAVERFAKEHSGCKPYNDFPAFLADKNIEVVTIGTPSGAHFEPAVAAAEAGKHIIVEKPLEITLDRCDKIIETAKKNKVKLATVFHSRFHESSQQIKNAVNAGRFGRLTLGDSIVKWYRTQQYYDSGAWRGTWELDGGGALMNQAIHSVDLLLWLMGQVVEVSAKISLLAHNKIAVEDTAVASLRFADGALGTIVGTTAAYPGYLKRVEISGSNGSAVLEEEDIVKWDFAETKPEDAAIRDAMNSRRSTAGGAADPSAIGFAGHAKLFRNVCNAIDGKEDLLVSGEEGRKSVEVILAIYKAAETGKSVHLPLEADPELLFRKNGVSAG